MRHLNENHTVKHAPYLDFVFFLPAAYKAVMENVCWDHMERMLFWVMLVVQCNILGRGCEMCQYCPQARRIKYPVEAREWDSDGIPHWIEISMLKLKGNNKAGLEYPLKLWRNYLNACLCPVLLITNWLAVSGIDDGPLFPNLVSTKLGDKMWGKIPTFYIYIYIYIYI